MDKFTHSAGILPPSRLVHKKSLVWRAVRSVAAGPPFTVPSSTPGEPSSAVDVASFINTELPSPSSLKTPLHSSQHRTRLDQTKPFYPNFHSYRAPLPFPTRPQLVTMDSPAFTTSFTGASVSYLPTLSSALSARRPKQSQTPVAVLGSRTSTATFGASQQPQTYTVKVMQKDRCTLVEVDRETNLRKALLDAKVDLYTLGGKLRNCGGGGQCGTCLIAVEDGVYATNGRSQREERLLEDKPDTWRLACRTLIHGDCTISTKPKE